MYDMMMCDTCTPWPDDRKPELKAFDDKKEGVKGLNKAQLVVIAHDVDPIELVVWLPALCKKMEIPYCIVKGKARLGANDVVLPELLTEYMVDMKCEGCVKAFKKMLQVDGVKSV
ncbi:60S ribosomal protein L7a-like [Rosa chinensis]|uniref:60S ribosomal protein L7a-like n=1 Tax=Rosa chinensis TaxID=74649 RepID=UPI000D09389F|nr:60S ribosomal protein L7a-like [Rosa chinensis]